jgi:polyphosphate glucokinase
VSEYVPQASAAASATLVRAGLGLETRGLDRLIGRAEWPLSLKRTGGLRRRRTLPEVKILAVDVGGTHVKVLASDQTEPCKINSGPTMSAAEMVASVVKVTADWTYDVVSLGYPGPVVHGVPMKEPANLGPGWVGFDYQAAFGRPTRIVNDAAMQALGAYSGGRMLFLGLGTGLGSAMIVDGVVAPMELAHLPYRKGRTYEDYVGLRGLTRRGKKKWRQEVFAVVAELSAALAPEYVVLGGGNARLLKSLPPNTRLCSNADAFTGGFRLWAESAIPAPVGLIATQ